MRGLCVLCRVLQPEVDRRIRLRRFVVWSDSDVIDSYTSRMMDDGLTNFIVGNDLHWEMILLPDRTF